MAGRGRAVVRQCRGRARLVVQEALHLHEDRELEQRVVIGPVEGHLEHVVREHVLLRRIRRDTRRDLRREMAVEIGARACATSSVSHAHFSRRSARSSSCLLSDSTRFDSLRTSRAPSNAMCTGLAQRVQKSRACVGSYSSGDDDDNHDDDCRTPLTMLSSPTMSAKKKTSCGSVPSDD